MAMSIDPIALEVLWSRLSSVTNEQQAALMRTAFSTVVRESQDLACGVFDTRGSMVAQSETGTPGHINAMATCMRHFMAAYPEAMLEPGDVLITNDPWMTAGQINDITLVTPIFRDGRVVAYFANTCHMLDIGGRILSAEAREVFEEGLYIPITKLFQRGERNEELFKIIRGNVRTPREVEGDLYAMASCNDVGGSQLLEFMHEFALDSIDPLAEAIIDRSDRATRAVAARLLIGHFLPGLIFGALARAMPDRLMADGAASIWITMFRGARPGREPYTFMLFQCGGTGARPTKDGLNNVGFPSGVAGVPAEVMESLTGLVMERREVRPDSGGPGKFRGGCGQFTTFADRSGQPWSMSGMYDRLKFPAQGMLGGAAGAAGSFELSDGRRANPKELLFHPPTTQVDTALPGGAGYGNPF